MEASMPDFEIIVPKLYEDFETGTLIKWLKSEGDFIKKGEQVFSLETDKAAFDIESDFEGVLKKITVGEGKVVKVMDVVGIITSSP
jgi:pyruvate/2-oxoglutarate dehydrogenase complex dihydrolipoamide acyltransferase (E2) component